MDWEYIVRKFSGVPQKTLYHYTSVEGLQGIIENEEIWATDHSFLNDISEFNHGLKAFKKSVKRSSVKDHNIFTGKLDYQSDLVEMVDGIERKEGIFVCSFSTRGDLLSQWRGYCPNGGFSIGYSAEIINTLAEKNNASLYRCVYGDENQNEIANQAIDEILHSYGTMNFLGFPKGHFHNHLKAAIRFLSPIMKNIHFEKEYEWRYVIQPFRANKVCYRPKGRCPGIIPYVKIPLPNSAIKRIYVGPGGDDREKVAEALIQFIKDKVGMAPEIVISDIPLR